MYRKGIVTHIHQISYVNIFSLSGTPLFLYDTLNNIGLLVFFTALDTLLSTYLLLVGSQGLDGVYPLSTLEVGDSGGNTFIENKTVEISNTDIGEYNNLSIVTSLGVSSKSSYCNNYFRYTI